MSDVDRLFEQYREEHRSSGDVDPRPYLAQVEGADQAELRALIDGFLQRAPSREWSAPEFAGSPAERLTTTLSDQWRQAAEPLGWAELLPKLRDKARIKRAELVARLADAIGAGGEEQRVAAYYHQMETGQLPSEGVSNTVLDALAGIVGETRDRLRAAGSAGGAEEARMRIAFARTAMPDERYTDAAAAAGMASPAEAAPTERDRIDELFTGGPEAGG